MLGSQAFPLARIVGACNRLIGSYVFTFSGGIRRRCPEVHFEEIAIDLLQARFWITSGWPTNHPGSSDSSPMCCADYNYAHAWPLPLARHWVAMRFNRQV
jgi:hypothetical protein